ncbi:hypothetical protein CIB48_g4713 [Xylaria polymorpha]|nr:hypothetical protein CIB48_g4713 [Xylaria polymorpha]
MDTSKSPTQQQQSSTTRRRRVSYPSNVRLQDESFISPVGDDGAKARVMEVTWNKHSYYLANTSIYASELRPLLRQPNELQAVQRPQLDRPPRQSERAEASVGLLRFDVA